MKGVARFAVREWARIFNFLEARTNAFKKVAAPRHDTCVHCAEEAQSKGPGVIHLAVKKRILEGVRRSGAAELLSELVWDEGSSCLEDRR
jgi:hypothetical protein